MRILSIAAIAALATINASTIMAQGLEEVIVTATKRAQNLQDVPVSVNTISALTIQEAGITDITDVAALVPALTVSTNLSPFATALRIRGFGTSQNDPSLEASVAFIIDGVYMGSSGLGMSDLTDIERIEVLQGPQGTLYGKNSNAGVISVVTKDPNIEELEGYIEASLGDYSLQRYVGLVSGPITDSLAYSVSGSWHDTDGWMESATGEDLNGVKDWNVRGKILWLPSDALSVRFTVTHVDRDTSCCAADATQTSAITDQLIVQGLPVPKNDAFDFKNNVNINSNFDLESDGVNIKVDYDLDTAVLKSLTAYNDYNYKTSTDADRSQLSVLGIVDDKYAGEQYSQELRLTSELEGSLQYMVGGFLAYEKRTRGGPSSAPVEIGSDIVPVGGAATGAGSAFGLLVQPGDSVLFDNSWKTETLALFGQSIYNITDDWSATLGLRYTTENKDVDLLTEPFSTAALFAAGGALVQIAFAPVDEDFNRESNNFTGLANLTYFVNEQVMAFASVSTGAKSGGFNGVGGEAYSREFKDKTKL